MPSGRAADDACIGKRLTGKHMAELIVKDGNGSRAYEMSDGKPLFAGRTVECDLYLPAPGVSRKHAVFLSRRGVCGIKDLDSSNGTFLNGHRLTRSVRLKNGDVIQIANFIIEFKTAQAEMPAEGPRQSSRRRNTTRKSERHRTARADKQAEDPVEQPLLDEKTPEAVSILDDVQPAPEAESLELGEKMTEEIPELSAPETQADAAPLLEPEPNAESEPVAPDEPVEAKPEREKKSSTSVLLPMPPKPVLPPRPEIADDEVGDGRDDAQFMIEEEESEDDGDASATELSKAAVEAGIVGEFAPDTEEDNQGGNNNGNGNGSEATAPVIKSGPGAVAQAILQPGPEFDPDSFPLDINLRQAIEARLCLYSFLADLKAERAAFIARRPKMADAVKSELARQDREVDKIPNATQAQGMIEKREAKKKALIEKIQEAKKNGTPPPPKPSRDMREAEEMAISQWTICMQSFNEALPAAYAEAFRLAKDEPLTNELIKAEIDPIPLMGGGVYYLALEYMQEEAKSARAQIKEQLAAASESGDKKSGKGGMLGMFGRSRNNADEEEEEDGDTVNPEELAANDQYLADRMAWLKQELAYMERTLIAEYWKVYSEVAVKHIPNHESMPVAVRAFLRHGVIGFKPWWLKDDVREFIIEDVRNDVVHHMVVSKNNTNILYADEYLAAVMNLECTPALDENLEINERNSPNWKADKALRKLINSTSQATLLRELLDSLASRIDKVEQDAAGVEQQIDKLLPGSKNFKAVKSELGQRRQAYKVEASKLTKLAAKIREETLAALQEAIEETNERFSSGELPKPTGEFLIKRECDALHKIGRLLANLKERFMPLVVRDNFQIDTDALNDRPSINGEILEMERRDPRIFLETLVPSKKKANRVDLRISPTIVLIPSAGVLAYSWNPRGKPEDGRLAIPTCFIRRRIRERQITYLLADFRWDTSKAAAGMDVMTSDTIVAAFMTVRWDWRKRSKEGREKGLIFTEQNDRTNWRRVYEAYSQTAYDAGKKLFQRNYDFYERIIGKYFDLPDNVQLLRK